MWGEKGYMRMARNIGNAAGQCGLAMQVGRGLMVPGSAIAAQVVGAKLSTGLGRAIQESGWMLL